MPGGTGKGFPFSQLLPQIATGASALAMTTEFSSTGKRLNTVPPTALTQYSTTQYGFVLLIFGGDSKLRWSPQKRCISSTRHCVHLAILQAGFSAAGGKWADLPYHINVHNNYTKSI